MPLTAAQIAHFLNEGWLAVPEFFDAREVAALQAEVRRLQKNSLLRNVSTEGDGKSHSTTAVNLQICPCSPHSSLIHSLRSEPKTTAAVRALIGDPVFFVLDQIFLKPARHGAGTNWHQDNGYFNQPKPTTSTGMWIAVHDANKANGTMNIVPRSHLKQEPHERDLNSDHHIYVPRVDESKAVTVELPAGGALFFNFGILHCTRANTTDRERAGLALHFINQDSMSAEFKAREPQGTCHVPLTDREGRLQPGIPSADTWAREVERCLASDPVLV